MKTKIESVTVELSMDEALALLNELQQIVYNNENDGKTDLTVIMVKKLQNHLGMCFSARYINDSSTNFILKANN